MSVLDKTILLVFATLMLAVVFIERNKRFGLPAHVVPPPAGDWILSLTNVPRWRDAATVIKDVSYLDITDAANTEGFAQ
jgi:hypothetical protein